MPHQHAPITPEVLDRIYRALEDEDSPAPWIQRAFEALAAAQSSARRVEELEAYVRQVGRLDADVLGLPMHGDQTIEAAERLIAEARALVPEPEVT